MFIWTQFIDQLPVGLLAQLVEHCTSIAEVMGSNPIWAWNFFQVLFTTTRFSSVLSYKDLLISSLHHSANIWIFIYLKSGLFFIAHNICLISPSFWRQNGQNFSYLAEWLGACWTVDQQMTTLTDRKTRQNADW